MPISISHAGLAQIFFCLTTSLALFTSRTWRTPRARAGRTTPRLRRRLLHLTSLVYVPDSSWRHDAPHGRGPRDSRLSAVVRPPDSAVLEPADRRPFRASPRRARRSPRSSWRPPGGFSSDTATVASSSRPAWLVLAAVAIQVTLGALVVLTGKQSVINTLHVATGAIVLGTSLVLTLRAFRVRF